jgi:transcriptional regulator with XRE-family HTH domain
LWNQLFLESTISIALFMSLAIAYDTIRGNNTYSSHHMEEQMHTHPLKYAREARGWSQHEVANKIGVSGRTVARWEQGRSLPYPYYREQLCQLFHLDASSLGLLPQEKTPPSSPDSQMMETLTPTSQIRTKALFDPIIPEALGTANSLLGRDALLDQLKTYLLNDNLLALTALQGLPGIGKTSLAIALAHDQQVQTHFSDGILWAGLGPQPDLQNILARWGSLLDITATDIEDPTNLLAWAQAIRTTIGSRRLLLVIDDAWQAQSALALHVGGPHCAYILTTRLPQVAFTFAQQKTVLVTELEEAAGLSLLARHVPQVVQAEPEPSRALVRAVGGLPLALNLLGRSLAAQAYSQQPRRVQQALEQVLDAQQRLRLSLPLQPSQRTPSLRDEPSISLQATIDVSVQQLRTVELAAFIALALFPAKPDSFSEEGAIAVGDIPLETLDTLWDSGLLESSSAGRYTIHQTVVDYARAHPLTQHESYEQARQRLVDYMVHYIVDHEQDLTALEQDITTIFTALDTAYELHLRDAFFTGSLHMITYMRIRGLYRQAQHYLQQALDIAIEQQDKEKQAIALSHLAHFSELLGEYSLAEDYAQRGLTLSRELKKDETTSILLTTLGLLAFNQADMAGATRYCEEGLHISRALHDLERMGQLLNQLGRIAHAQGDYARAEALYQEGLQVAQQSGNQELISRQLTALGGVAIEQGKYELTERYSLEGLSIARTLGYREITGYLLNNLGIISYLSGKLEQGENYSTEGLALARQIGNRGQICRHLANLGRIFVVKQNPIAKDYIREAVELARQLGNKESLPLLLMNLGEALTQQDDFEGANAAFKESVALGREQHAWWAVGYALASWGELYLNHHMPDAASAIYQQVLDLSDDIARARDVIARAKYGLARVAALHNDFARARLLGQESLQELEQIGHYKAAEVNAWLQHLPATDAEKTPASTQQSTQSSSASPIDA